jgi:hypothetical protein
LGESLSPDETEEAPQDSAGGSSPAGEESSPQSQPDPAVASSNSEPSAGSKSVTESFAGASSTAAEEVKAVPNTSSTMPTISLMNQPLATIPPSNKAEDDEKIAIIVELEKRQHESTFL